MGQSKCIFLTLRLTTADSNSHPR